MDENIHYETISFTLPWVGLWATLICGAIALTLILVAVVRVRRHRAHSARELSLIHISEPTRRTPISYAVFCPPLSLSLIHI